MDYSYPSMGPQSYFPGSASASASAFQPSSQNDVSSAAAAPQDENYPLNSTSAPFDPSFVPFHQQSFHYDPSAFLAPSHEVPPHAHAHTHTQVQPQASSPSLLARHDSNTSAPNADVNVQPTSANELGLDEHGAMLMANRSSSEEKEVLTPQQSRRKAQNRAAQRAFRERKERHVKELEAQLNSLQHQSAQMNGENERLRREIAKIATENKILRATSASSANNRSSSVLLADHDVLVGPLSYTPTDPPFALDNSNSNTDKGKETESASASASGHGHGHGHFISLNTQAIDEETGEPLLGTGPTWDYIQAHELVQKGLVDVGDVSERLKKLARCNGQGPVFKECDIRRAITESAVAGGRDELL